KPWRNDSEGKGQCQQSRNRYSARSIAKGRDRAGEQEPEDGRKDEKIRRRIEVSLVDIELTIKDVVEQAYEKAWLELKDGAGVIDRPGCPERMQKCQPYRRSNQHKEKQSAARLR